MFFFSKFSIGSIREAYFFQNVIIFLNFTNFDNLKQKSNRKIFLFIYNFEISFYNFKNVKNFRMQRM